MAKPQPKVITNFGGRLTRFQNGDLNSGFAKFASSWGYDPFSKPGNLTWLYQPDDIKGSAVTDAVFATKTISPVAEEQYVYGIGSSSKVYRINPLNSGGSNQPLDDAPSVIAAIGSVSGTFNYGADLDYYLSKLHISSDSRITRLDLTGANIASVTGTTSVTAALYHPLCQFQGGLFYGNGNNIGKIDSTGIVVNGAVLSPSLPVGVFIRDLDVTPDGAYMILTASYLYPDRMDNPSSAGTTQQSAVDSFKFLWNGIDAGVTAYEALPSFPASALNTFLNKQFLFNQDTFGTAIYEGSQKLLTLPNNLAPMPNGATPNGTFLTWVSPEGVGSVMSSDSSYDNTYSSLYYYGQLDAENPAGLFRLLRISPSASNTAYRTPMNMMVNSFGLNREFVTGWGKHYISVWEWNNGGGSSTYHFYRFVLPPAANTSPTLGVYETQTELFSKKTGCTQVRIYTEPTIAGNGFQLDLIGANGNPIQNGTFTYAYGDPIDNTTRINFNPKADSQYAIGVRLTNTGTTNMTIKKVELDIEEQGK